MMLAALALAASAPSFDCTKATTRIEKMVCADPGLAAADRAMAKLYAAVPRSDRHTRSEQADFLRHKFYRSRCSDKDCLVVVYEDRLGDLFGASQLKTRDYASGPIHGTLNIMPVGDGWYAFKAQGLWIGKGEGEVNDAEAAGVFKLVNGRASRAPTARYDCGWKIQRLPHDRWKLEDWPGSDGPACGGLNATVEGIYSP
jgi:uncharacterized protein